MGNRFHLIFNLFMAEIIDLLSDSEDTPDYFPVFNSDYCSGVNSLMKQDFGWNDFDDEDRPAIDYDTIHSKVLDELADKDQNADCDSDATIIYNEEENLTDDIVVELSSDTNSRLSSPVAFVSSEKTEVNSIPYCGGVKNNSSQCFSESNGYYSGCNNFEHSSEPTTSILVPTNSKKCKGLNSKKNKIGLQVERDVLKKGKTLELTEKKAEALRQKAIRAALAFKQKSIKPDECIKLITVLIDTEIINNSSYGSQICAVLQKEEIKYSVQSLDFPGTIMWTRLSKETILNDNEELVTIDRLIEEDNLISILLWDKVINLVVGNELESYIVRLKSGTQKEKITLLLIGMEKYFSYQKNKINREFTEGVTGSQAARRKKNEVDLENVPRITKDELELALTNVQLKLSVNHRWVDSAEQIGTLVEQFTRAISKIEFKKEKLKRGDEGLSWFAKGDNKSCVKVDKNGFGLLSLWQQQILQFNNVCLEVAQAIVGRYKSPQQLLAAYGKCDTCKEAETLLQDIPVRREAGILSSTRRVGPELSKKIYRFLTSKDPNLEL